MTAPSATPPAGPLPGRGPQPTLHRLGQAGLVGLWLAAALLHALSSPAARVLSWPLSYLALEVLASFSLGYRAARTAGPDRWAWGLLAGSAGLEVPNLLSTYALARNWIGPWATSLPSYLGLASGVLALLGVLSFAKGPDWRGYRLWRRALDGLLFAVSVLFLLFVLGGHAVLGTGHEGLSLRMFSAYLNAALLGGGVVFITSYQPAQIRGPLGWLGASALAWLAALSAWAFSGFSRVPSAQGWIVLAGCIPLFQGLAAWSQRPQAGPEAARGELPWMAWIPYLPVGLALGALAIVLPRSDLESLRGAIGTFLVMVFLLVLRQVQAILDLQAGRRTLEDRVRLRTEALERAQAMLMRTERMNALALMGAGIAHDLNNYLTALLSSAELAALKVAAGEAAEEEDLRRIVATAERAVGLTRQLMGFARPEEAPVRSPLDLVGEVRALEPTLRLLLPRSVVLDIQAPASEALLVNHSRLQVEQMLVNLVVNARDAMPQGGHLRIRVAPVEPGLALLEVSDTGVGMAPHILERIFDPFFTTKPPGKGTGLGLASLKALVEEGGGRLEAVSLPAQGSRFRLLLPRLATDDK